MGCSRYGIAHIFVIGALVIAPGCKLLSKVGVGGDVPEKPKTCVDDLRSAEEAKFDLDGDVKIKLSAALQGSVHLKELTKKLDRDVSDACLSIARDLDPAPVALADTLPDGERAKTACEAAAGRIKAAREQGGVVLLLYPQPPTCTIGLDDYSRCAKSCDLTMASFSAGMQCDPESAFGRCETQCSGICMQNAADTCKGMCRGVCKGSCDQDFYGKCGGRCVGTCDGTQASGKCKGTCEGKCLSEADGSCQGKCTGPCEGTCTTELKKGKCEGTCGGTCSKPLLAARCGTALAPAEMVPECGALCDAKLAREVNCQGANVHILIYNSTKEGAGERVKSALSRRLEILITAEEGMKPMLDRAHEGITSSFANVQEALEGNASAQAQTGTCIEAATQQQQAAQAALQSVREATAAVFSAIKN